MLLALTVVEVSTIFLPHGVVPHWMLGTFLMALAVGKAVLVAMYYMHLRYDPWLLAGVFLGPFGLALFFACMMVLQVFF
jgi:caa(3)-type oxidase subunit IV